jgi:hypothetical protein
MKRNDVPQDVAEIREAIDTYLNTKDDQGRIIGNAKVGVYAFFDYDGEPIYVGQTNERLRTRIRRHLTNQRTDAVAMNVLDPFEVAEIEMWPFFELEKANSNVVGATLCAAEFTVYQRVLAMSSHNAVLNEKLIPVADQIELPPSLRARIIPDSIFESRKHADIRIARRASTIAALARVISERAVTAGLRRTLLTQARRLEHLAAARLEESGGNATSDPEENS